MHRNDGVQRTLIARASMEYAEALELYRKVKAYHDTVSKRNLDDLRKDVFVSWEPEFSASKPSDEYMAMKGLIVHDVARALPTLMENMVKATWQDAETKLKELQRLIVGMGQLA